MERLELEVSLRERSGKSAARKLRAAGAVPAVVYGGAEEQAVSLSVDERALATLLRRGTNQIIDLRGGDGFVGRLVLLKETQRHPVTRRVLHCDFYAIDATQKIEVSVPVHVEGKAAGVELGGILDVIVREVEVRCLPLEIPEALTIDVSELLVGDALHVSDLVLPKGVDLLADREQTLVHVAAPRVEEEPEEEAELAAEGEAAPADGETPATEGEAPKAEESAGD